MSDQNIPNEKNKPFWDNPENKNPNPDKFQTEPFSAEESISSPLSSEEMTYSQTPNVVVTSEGNGTPWWFYFIFGITFIAFLVVTAFLVMSLSNKQNISVPAIIPTATPISEAVVTPTEALTPIPTSAPVDQVILKLNELGSSDEVADLELEVKNTDLSGVEDILSLLDSKIK